MATRNERDREARNAAQALFATTFAQLQEAKDAYLSSEEGPARKEAGQVVESHMVPSSIFLLLRFNY